MTVTDRQECLNSADETSYLVQRNATFCCVSDKSNLIESRFKDREEGAISSSGIRTCKKAHTI